MPIANIAGQAVHGEDFFERPREVQRLWGALTSGVHILLVAPRRVGKTSLVEHLRDKPLEHYHLLYIQVESIDSEEEFFKRLYQALCADNTFHPVQMKEKTKAFLGRLKKIEVAGVGIEIEKAPQTAYEQFNQYVIKMVGHQDFGESKLVLVLDEFPQVVENIWNKHGAEAAIRFLQQSRELRHVADLRGKLQFVYTGSIGLEHIVGRLNASKTINDLRVVGMQPMSEQEARELIREIVEHSRYEIDAALFTPDIVVHILGKVQWWIPFYIQLLLQVLSDMANEQVILLTTADIDNAFEEMLNSNNHFEHWVERLRNAFKHEDYKYAEKVLNQLAPEGAMMEHHQLYDIAVGSGGDMADRYRQIISVLKHDGYITDEGSRYRFNSPVVQAWWRKNVAH